MENTRQIRTGYVGDYNCSNHCIGHSLSCIYKK